MISTITVIVFVVLIYFDKSIFVEIMERRPEVILKILFILLISLIIGELFEGAIA